VAALLIAGVAAPVITAPAQAETFKFQSGPLTNLNPAGDTINGGFTAFPTKAGMYIQQCIEPIGGARPATCSDSLQLWVAPGAGPGSVSPTGPIAMPVSGTISARGVTIDCTKVSCGLFFRLDRTATADTSEDKFLPITFRAGSAAPVLPADEVVVTMNGVPLTRNVALNLAYRTPIKVAATAKSGLPVTLSSLTPDCTYANGEFVALKGAGQCALAHSTAGNATTAATRANYPFILVTANQKIEGMVKNIKVAKPKTLPLETNFGSEIVYKSSSKNCLVEGNLIEAKRSGFCTITAKAAARSGLWNALDVKYRLRATK
jgi:hypothetical protein